MTDLQFESWVDKMYTQFQAAQDNGYAKAFCKNYTVTVVDLQNTTIGKSCCHPNDAFDYNIGVAIAWARANAIEVPTIDEYTPWRANNGKGFYFIGSGMETIRSTDERESFANACYDVHNYFQTKERSEEVSEKIRLLLKLEYYHDLYCPNYVPDFLTKDIDKWTVSYSFERDEYIPYFTWVIDYTSSVYFDSEYTAKKVAEQLNNEKRQNDRYNGGKHENNILFRR